MTESRSEGRSSRTTMLAVRLGGDMHALPIEAVEEVLPALPVEAVPQCPRFVRGVVFVRGHLIPVLDAAERLGMEGHMRPAEPHIVCLQTEGRIVGLEVDEALDLMEVDLEATLPAADVASAASFLTGLVEHDGQVIRLLDPRRLIAREEVAVLDQLPRTADA